MIAGAVLVVVGVAVLLYAEGSGRRSLRWVGKPLASAGFLLAALGAPSLRLPSGAGWLLLAALASSALGDILLVPKSRTWLIGGMAAFGVAHLLYGAWFLTLEPQPVALALAALTLLVAGHAAWLWLAPHVREHERLPVRIYMLVLSLMAATAVAVAVSQATAGAAMHLAAALGGVLVYLSDLAVARQRFVKPAFANRAWGLPAYYLGQLLLASALLAR